MKYSLQISQNAYIFLGETKEELVYDLDENGIKYSIPFDKTLEAKQDGKKVKETIVHIASLNIEISLANDIVKYITCGVNKYNTVYKTTVGVPASLQMVKEMMAVVSKKVGVDPKTMFTEKINLKTMDTVMIANGKDNKRVRIHVMTDMNGNVHIGTLRYI